MARLRDRQPETVVDLRDERELRAIYHAHGPELYRFVQRQLGDASEAQDVVQDVFLRAWRAADSYDPALATVRTWLFSIARNAIIDQVRRHAVRPWQQVATTRSGEGDERAAPAPRFDDRLMDGWVVEEALRRLGAEHRDAIVQTHLRQRPYGQVAAELGIPVGTLRSRVFYGLKALRLAMEEMGVEP